MGILYIVATPIGNLDDITIRAIKTLLTVDAIACEDTRRAGILLKTLRERYNHLVEQSVATNNQPLVSYFEQNEYKRIPEILNGLKNGLNVALISDAGTPAVSDPGFRLVRECVMQGIQVVSIPGPSSVISALVTSGLPTDKFFFVGFPPHKGGNRMTFFKNIKASLASTNATCVMFESPYKLVRTLEEMKEVFGDIDITLARELTKIHEEILPGMISVHLEKYEKKEPKGEFVLLFHLA